MENNIKLQLIIYSVICLTLLTTFFIGYALSKIGINKQKLAGIITGAILTMIAIPLALI